MNPGKVGAAAEIDHDRGRRRLNSWKAIAHYLDRKVRSVQRWEHERGLPVYRVPGDKGGTVFAYADEIDTWLRSRKAGELDEAARASDGMASRAGSARAGPSRYVWTMVGTVLLLGAVVATVVAMRPWTIGPAPTRALAAARSVAVLPMKDLSVDSGQTYFVDGFTEELVTELAQIRSFRVISRTSTMIYKGSRKPLPEIARELHARYIVEGSVAREGDRVRVIAQLIDAATDTHISARTYDTDLKDVLDVQGRISRAIAEDVSLDLSPDEKARLTAGHHVDPAAHDLYLQAAYQFAQQTPASIAKSLELFHAAAARDPSFARAYVGIAQAQAALLQITATDPRASFLREKEALAEALSIDPHLGDARGLMASLAYWNEWDWARAEREFRLALADGAQAPTEQRFGYALVMRGRYAEGLSHLRRALELDPLGKSPRVNWVIALSQVGRLAEARRETEAMLKSSPDFLAGHVLLASAAVQQHDCAQAGVQARWIAARYPSSLADFVSAGVAACRHDFAAARRSLERAATYKTSGFASPYQLAVGYSAIHDRSAALSYLEKSANLREPQVLCIEVEHTFDWLRRDPRFIALEARLHLRT